MRNKVAKKIRRKALQEAPARERMVKYDGYQLADDCTRKRIKILKKQFKRNKAF